jgi:hypothetical protein
MYTEVLHLFCSLFWYYSDQFAHASGAETDYYDLHNTAASFAGAPAPKGHDQYAWDLVGLFTRDD